MAGNSKQSNKIWSEAELEFIRQNYGKVPARTIANHLQRSLSSVQSRAHILGVRSPLHPKTRWDKESDQALIRGWGDGGSQAIARIARQLNRPTRGVKHRAYKLGLLAKTHQRRWGREELSLLASLAGEVSITELHRRHQALCDERGWSRRSKAALQPAINSKLGASWKLEGDCFSANAVAEGLRCHPQIVLGWLHDKAFAKVLKPERISDADRARWLIPRKNLAKFFKQFPAELERTKPDLTWLVSLFD